MDSSHGLFARDAPFKDQSGRRNVSFNEHDDRGGGNRGSRGGWKRGRGRGGRGRGRGKWRGRGGGNFWGNSEEVDDEGDITMDDAGGRNALRRGGRPRYGKSSPGERGSVFTRLGGTSSGSVFSRLSGMGGERRGASWHKITIPRGAKQNEEWVLRQLKSSIPEQFQPVRVHVMGDKLMFFVEESRAANQMKRLGELECRDDCLPIYVKPCPPPKGVGEDSDQRPARFSRPGRGGRGGMRGGATRGGRLDGDIQMEEDNTAVILQVLGQRFDTATRSLDLSDMFHDQTLREHGVKGVMYDRSFVTAVLSLIGQHCPDLLALDLSNNRLQHLDMYAELPAKCASLQILNLSENQLRSAAELENVQGMDSLTTLVLEKNPFSQRNQDLVSYASNMRKLFPNLQLLDGQQLPSPVKFDLPVSAGQLPPIEKNYLVNDEVKSLVVTFLEQFYNMYDGDSREKLLEAYSNDAVFSLSVSAPSGNVRGPFPQSYMPQNRNLCGLNDPSKKISLLKHGRIDIVQCLRDLPRTRHHPGTFNVDVIKATPVSTAFVVYGLFSEVTGPKPENCHVRAFSRTFMLAAAGNGCSAPRESGSSAPAKSRLKRPREKCTMMKRAGQKGKKYAEEEMRKFQAAQQLQQQPTLQQIASMNQPSTSAAAIAGPSFHSPPPVFANPQEEAVRKLSEETGMNLEWSRKCLSENLWDYSKAFVAFSLLQKQGKVPPQAFL